MKCIREVVVLFVLLVLVNLAMSKSIGLVRDIEIELPANEKISKRDVSAVFDFDGVSEELVDSIYQVNQREKRSMQTPSEFPLGDVLGRL